MTIDKNPAAPKATPAKAAPKSVQVKAAPAKRDNAPPKGAAAAAKKAKAATTKLPGHFATPGESKAQRDARWNFRKTPQNFHRGTEIFIDSTKLGDTVLPKAFAVDTKYTIISVFQPVETESGVCEVTLRDAGGDLHGYVPASVLSHWKTFGKAKPEAEAASTPLEQYADVLESIADDHPSAAETPVEEVPPQADPESEQQ